MERAWLSLGSNLAPRQHLGAALAELRARFGVLAVSPTYVFPAVGFDGPDFWNLAVGLDSDLEPAALNTWLHAPEDPATAAAATCRATPRARRRGHRAVRPARAARRGQPEVPRGELKHAFVPAPGRHRTRRAPPAGRPYPEPRCGRRMPTMARSMPWPCRPAGQRQPREAATAAAVHWVLRGAVADLVVVALLGGEDVALDVHAGGRVEGTRAMPIQACLAWSSGSKNSTEPQREQKPRRALDDEANQPIASAPWMVTRLRGGTSVLASTCSGPAPAARAVAQLAWAEFARHLETYRPHRHEPRCTVDLRHGKDAGSAAGAA